MDHYLDIRLRPDPEFPPAQLMSVLFGKLHQALVAQGGDRIGVSFPDLDESRSRLGERLRIHASADDLRALLAQPWLEGLRDHLQFGEPAVVPHPTPYRQVSRVQAKSNPERLRRRLMRRHDLSEEEARKRIPDTVARALDLPFVTLRSQSTGQHFRLFIRHGPLQVTAEEGGFTCYGLSKGGFVPWF